MKQWILFAAWVSAFALVSCNKVENSEIDQLLNEETKKVNKTGTATSKTNAKVEEKKNVTSSPDGNRAPGSNDPKLEEVRKMIKVGNYDGVIATVGNSDNMYLKYYAGMSYYAKMLMKFRFSESERLGFQAKALTILKQVGNEAPDDLLKARGLLWYGYALHVLNESFAKNKEAIDVFYQIQTTTLKDTDVYDDSLLYTAKVYYKMGWYIQAREYYKKLATEPSKDNQVYDPDVNKFFTPKEASAIGLERIRQISLAGLRDKEAAERRAREASTPPATSSSSSSSSTSASSSSGSSSSGSSASTSTSSTTPQSTDTTSSSSSSTSSTASSSSSTNSASGSTDTTASSSGTSTTSTNSASSSSTTTSTGSGDSSNTNTTPTATSTTSSNTSPNPQ